MSDKSTIEWTDATWNPVRGCSRVSEGCRNCYAERVAARFSGPGLPYQGFAELTPGGPRWTGRVELVPGKLAEPLSWQRPRRVFVNSMSDLFHEELGFEDIAAVWGIMAACPRHTFQILTKRPERMRDWFSWMREFAMQQRDIASAPSRRQTAMKAAFTALGETDAVKRRMDPAWAGDHDLGPWPLPNVWLGVSVEDQGTADLRIPLLLSTPAAVRFISAEPLLGPVSIIEQLDPGRCDCEPCSRTSVRCTASRHPLDWVIVGGESGPGARPVHPDWIRRLRDQCEAADVTFFFKQWGEWAPNCLCGTAAPHPTTPRPGPGCPGVMFRCGKHAAGRMLDWRTHDGFPRGLS